MIKSHNGKPYFRLCVSCPGKCSKENTFWCHASCHTNSFIDIEGFIFCQKYIDNAANCKKFFLKDCGFKCDSDSHGNEYLSFKKFSDFLQALGNAIRSIENTTDVGEDVEEFMMAMNTNLIKNWKKF